MSSELSSLSNSQLEHRHGCRCLLRFHRRSSAPESGSRVAASASWNGDCLATYVSLVQRDGLARRRFGVANDLLGKLKSIDARSLSLCKSALGRLVCNLLRQHTPTNVMVIGMAESSLLLSAIVQSVLDNRGVPSHRVCSTRRPIPGIRFSEDHSHAPDHFLMFPSGKPESVWIVEDEVTTGRTLLNLARRIAWVLGVTDIVVLALVDLRPKRLRKALSRMAKSCGLSIRVESLLSIQQPDTEAISLEEHTFRGGPDDLSYTVAGEDRWILPSRRPAVSPQSASTVALPWFEMEGTILVVGEAMDLGLSVLNQNPDAKLRHVSLSPWKVDGVAVRERLEVAAGYFLYNATSLEPPMSILFDPVDRHVAGALWLKLERSVRGRIALLEA